MSDEREFEKSDTERGETELPVREGFEITRTTVDPHAEPPYEDLAVEREQADETRSSVDNEQ